MRDIFNNLLTSGRKFNEFQEELESKYQIINIAILLSMVGLIFGIVVNYSRGISGYIPIESLLLFIDFIMLIALRYSDSIFRFVITIITAQFTFLFLFLIYVSDPGELKHLWIFTYPIILLYFQDKKIACFWLAITFFFLLIAPFQNFVELKYSTFQIIYISVVLLIVSLIIYFYQLKMDEAKNKILQQQDMLLDFNSKLEEQVLNKTTELRELNESLESKVQEKIDELVQKDKILTVQSKQAVMGEMISMIAHQWRQPLSTITLQISNLQVKQLLGKEISMFEFNKAINNISDNIIYLSETVDDFQTYFRPDKDRVEVDVEELIQKALNLVAARIKESGIEVRLSIESSVKIKTYVNEFLQIILNILNNAIDAINTDAVDRSVIDIGIKSDQNMLFIDIKDSARGIEGENMPKLFEPYFSTKGKNGTGLGLYMCQMIVQKQLNGEILVKTSKSGSTFTIKVPIDND